MARPIKQTTVDRNKYVNFKAVADNFYEGAEVAAEYEYWNAAGVLIIHAAIAYGDAITIKYGGLKNRGEDHHQLINVIDNVVAHSDDKKKALIQLNKIIAHKNAVSYSGNIYDNSDIDKLKKHIDRFKTWAESIL